MLCILLLRVYGVITQETFQQPEQMVIRMGDVSRIRWVKNGSGGDKMKVSWTTHGNGK